MRLNSNAKQFSRYGNPMILQYTPRFFFFFYATLMWTIAKQRHISIEGNSERPINGSAQLKNNIKLQEKVGNRRCLWTRLLNAWTDPVIGYFSNSGFWEVVPYSESRVEKAPLLGVGFSTRNGEGMSRHWSSESCSTPSFVNWWQQSFQVWWAMVGVHPVQCGGCNNLPPVILWCLLWWLRSQLQWFHQPR